MLLTARAAKFATSVYLVPRFIGFEVQYLAQLGKYDFIMHGLKTPLYWSNVHEIPIPDEIGYYAKTKWKLESLRFDFRDNKPQHGLIWPNSSKIPGLSPLTSVFADPEQYSVHYSTT
jgi:hypothetical protein